MPELKPLKLLTGDVLYQQRDYADEVYLIKEGSVKLNVDISDYLIESFPYIVSSNYQNSEEERLAGSFNDLSFPFIHYVEGSYFGDVDIIIPGLKVFERDSMAVAVSEVNLFVLQRNIIVNTLKKQFGKEIKQMEDIAKIRKAKHNELI